MTKNYVLGLDLGTNSIGWACLGFEESKILSSGVRILMLRKTQKTANPWQSRAAQPALPEDAYTAGRCA